MPSTRRSTRLASSSTAAAADSQEPSSTTTTAKAAAATTAKTRATRKKPAAKRAPPKADAPSTKKPKTTKASTAKKPAAKTTKKTAAKATKTPIIPAAAAIVTPPSAAKKNPRPPVDLDISVKGKQASNFRVVQDPDRNDLYYDAVLNQCNIGNNNNKYYRLQLLQDPQKSYFTWFRWGRVGEPTRSSSSTWQSHCTLDSAIREFNKKYKAKTANAFGAATFVPKAGKYTQIEIDNDVDVPDDMIVTPVVKSTKIEYAASKLDSKTQELMQVLFSEETRNEVLSTFHLDLKRLPLGVPSLAQINKGVAILKQIEDCLDGKAGSSGANAQSLSSQFYTAIPHSFGRSIPPAIRSHESLRQRYDMCNILLDIYETNETIRRLRKEEEKAAAEEETKLLPNPTDAKFHTLKAGMDLLDSQSREFKLISDYFDKTKSSHCSSKILNVWAVDRQKEAERFAAFDKVDNRRLLWHGTNIAVVAPIITSGLRIMPHSGGRVGAGIYLAGMQVKSAQYTSGYGAKFACMFLCEAPLGRQHPVTSDGPHASGLRQAPAGYDSVHAVGDIQTSSSTTITLDGQKVAVPTSQGVRQSNVSSSFQHDEFLVYNEAQVRLRYVLTVKL